MGREKNAIRKTAFFVQKSFSKKQMLFIICIFFRPWEDYDVVLWNSAVPKAATRASEMVLGSRSNGVTPDFLGC